MKNLEEKIKKEISTLKVSEKSFRAGIKFLLNLGYKSPEEIEEIESKAVMHGFDFAQDKW